MSGQTQNLLLLYLLQCRAKDFIERFEAQNNRCFMGVYSLYQLTYSNYLLLSDDDWNPSCISIIDQCREECKKILDYLQTIITIPDSFESDTMEHFKCFANYDDDDGLEYILDGSLSQLISMGYREIDCLLYEAGMKLNYAKVKQLLEFGANPNAWISSDYFSEMANEADIYDAYCLNVDIDTIISDAIDIDIYTYWECGIRNELLPIRENVIYSLSQGAAYRLMDTLISMNMQIKQ